MPYYGSSYEALMEAVGQMVNHFSSELIDIEKFVRVNELKEIINPVFFNGPTPTPDGLLSNEIFGITKNERAGIYAYVDLGGYFLNPLAYKVLCTLDRKIEAICNGTENFSINEKGEIVKDENGSTGIDWLKRNFSKIDFRAKESASKDRETKIKFIEKFKDKIWIQKWIVIPPYYRDVDTKQASIGVGEINKLYSALIIASKALKDSSDYGLSLSDATKGRIQNTLKQIFDWFGAGTTIGGEETGGNLPGKTGIIKKGVMYKTVDYSVRLVMSSSNNKVENIEDLMVDMDHAACPLEAAIVLFQPFIIFYCRRFFENEFAGKQTYTIIHQKSNTELSVPIEDYQIMYSDVEIVKQIERFVHGYSNRFQAIPVPIDKVEFNKMIKEKKLTDVETPYIGFKGRQFPSDKTAIEEKDYSSYPLMDRPMTWCDLFYLAACEMTADKMILITRFPIDRYLNQYPSKINIKSTIQTEPIILDNKVYKWWPKIRKEDIGKNTSSIFSPTLTISNGHIDVMGMDFDGDTSISKGIYTIEANAELEKAANSKVNIIGMDGISPKKVTKECIMTMYSLTIQPDKNFKRIDPIF